MANKINKKVLRVILMIGILIQLYLLYDLIEIMWTNKEVIVYILEALILGYLACFTNLKSKELFANVSNEVIK